MSSFYLFLYFTLFHTLMLFGTSTPNDELISKRVLAHMVIGDHLSACNEAFSGLSKYPNSKKLWQAYLKALAKAGDEKSLMCNWRSFVKRFPDEKFNREVLECLAWAIIEKGAVSSSPPIRVIAMLGAFFSQDAKGVALLCQALNDHNSFLRAAALKLASNLQDASLQSEVLRRFKIETVWNVRLEAIKAVGKLSIEAARDDLSAIVADNKSSSEEKVAAIEALVEMSDAIQRDQLQKLIQSDRAGMRLLACELVSYFEQTADLDLLIPLICDHHAEVRAKALHTFGILRISAIQDRSVADIIIKSLSDPDPVVGITAAWVLTLYDQGRGLAAFENFLQSQISEIRLFAAAALAATGKYGVELAFKIFKQNNIDPYVRMNVAIGLIGQREHMKAACECLYEALTQQKERWMWNEEANFRFLAPSKIKHDDAIPNYPEAVNQITRLDILEILAIVHYSQAQLALKNFLQDRAWGVSGMASALLLTECDEDAVDLVKGLLNDTDQKVRIQAALILALWGSGDDAVNLLQDAYQSADKELKGQILEGLGRVGSSASFAFLVEKLYEPYQTLRLISAAALLDCLYH